MTASCVYVDEDNHSDDILEVYHGKPEPTFVCGYHEQRFGVPGWSRSPLNADLTPKAPT